MKKVLILEDNKAVSSNIKSIITEIDTFVHVFETSNFEDAIRIAFSNDIDLFILDVVLTTKVPGDVSGLQFAQIIRKYDDYLFTPIIFVTVLEDPTYYAFQNLHCYAYLEKPFSYDEAVRLIKDALKYSSPINKERIFFFRKDGLLYATKLSEIIYVDVNKHVMYVHMIEHTLEVPYITIKQFLKEVGSAMFVQCNRHTIVNKQYIKNIDLSNRYIQMDNNDRVEIGITFKKKLLDEMMVISPKY